MKVPKSSAARKPAPRWLKRAALASLALFALLLLSALMPAWGQQVNSRSNSVAFSGSSLTCVLPNPQKYDTAVVGITSTKTVSSVADTLNTYASQKSAGATTSAPTEGGLAYLYTAKLGSVPAVGTPLTITVTFSSSTQGGVWCADVAGFGNTAAHTASGTGTTSGNDTTTQAATVGSYTPTAGNFLVSVYAGAMCGGLGSVAYPFTPASGQPLPGSTQLVDNAQAGADLQCSYPGTHPATGTYSFSPVGYAEWNLSASAVATTQAFTATFAHPIENRHTGGNIAPASTWAEVSMDLPRLTVLNQAVSETIGLVAVVSNSTGFRPAETVGLGHAQGGAQATPGEGLNLGSASGSTNGQSAGLALCAIVSYGGANVSSSCVAPSYAVALVVNNAHPLVGQSVTFTATASPFVFGPYFIKIFDITNSSTSSLVSCVGTSCVLTQASHHSGTQLFQAGVAKTGLHGDLANSTIIAVTWGGGGGGNLCVYYVLNDGGQFDPPVLTYYSNGAQTTYTLTFTKACVAQDTGTPWSVSPTTLLTGLSVNSAERGFSQNVTFSSTGGGTFHWVYWHQVEPAVSYRFTQPESETNHPTFYYTQFNAAQTATMSRTPAQYWVDFGTTWRATNPLTTTPDLTVWYGSPAGGIVQSANPIVVTYDVPNLCTGPWLSQLEHGCFWASMGPYITIFGLQGFMGIVMLGVDGAVWIQTKNGWIVVIVMSAAAVLFGGALPQLFFLFALVLTGISVGAVFYRLFWKRT